MWLDQLMCQLLIYVPIIRIIIGASRSSWRVDWSGHVRLLSKLVSAMQIQKISTLSKPEEGGRHNKIFATQVGTSFE